MATLTLRFAKGAIAQWFDVLLFAMTISISILEMWKNGMSSTPAIAWLAAAIAISAHLRISKLAEKWGG